MSGMTNTSRRAFLAGAATLAAAFVTKGAAAQDVTSGIFGANGDWDDQFDAQVSQGAKVSSTLPLISQQTVAYTERAIMAYNDIVARGGWPTVNAGGKLKLGVEAPEVEDLRRRLMISGDLSQTAGISPSFDTYVDAAVKRFQARHGLPVDGVLGKFSLAAMNVSAPVRLGQLQTNLARISEKAAEALGQRYVMVNIPAAQVEAVENGRVVQRHTAIVGKIDRQSPLVNSAINEVIINPYWNAPESIVRKDIIPLMRKDPTYLEKNHIRIIGPSGEIDPTTVDWNTEDAAKFLLRQDPGANNAMASVKINFPSPDGVYMHDTPQQGLFGKLMRFESSGCVRVQNVRDLVTWLLRDTPGWNRQRFEQTIKSGANTPVALAQAVPVTWVYVSAWSTGDGVAQFRDDIYGRDGVDELKLSSLL
jgi:L,D-transpeptidase YcbB